MTFFVAAIDCEAYKKNFLYLPNNAKQASFAEQMESANLVLKNCIDECQITRFSGDIVVPDKALFDGWAGALPDLELVKNCLEFLRELQYPKTTQKQQTRPWWIRTSQISLAVIDPDELKTFSEDVHTCKFFEIFLANIISRSGAEQFVELGEFLELSAVNDCMLFAWRSK